jgi:hypothetical protein
MKKVMFWHKIVIFITGLFLFLDGLLSLIFGNACLSSCLNNSNIGNIVRVVRLVLGVFLIYISLFMHNWID